MSSRKTSSSNASSTKKSGSKTRRSNRSKSKPSSRTSTKSSDSLASIGIGPPTRPLVDASYRFRLMPEQGDANSNTVNTCEQRISDCLVYVIVCEKHKAVALTKTTEQRPFSWLPFIQLPSVFSWKRMSRIGLMIILGKKDTTTEAEEEESDADTVPLPVLPPTQEPYWIEQFRVPVPKTNNQFALRLTQVVKMVSNQEGTCCANTPESRIRWVKMATLASGASGDDLWGHEVATICSNMLTATRQHFLEEFSLDNCHPQEDTEEAALLKQLNWSVDQVRTLFADFLEHQYPAFQMTPCSFRCFLLKKSLLDGPEKRMARLFRAMAGGGNKYLSFSQLLTGIAAMDPKASNKSTARARLIFNYYDRTNQGSLALAQLSELMADLQSKPSSSDFEKQAAAMLNSISEDKLNLDSFTSILGQKNQTFFPGAERLLRLNRSYFVEAKKASKKSPALQKKRKSNSKSKSGSSSQGKSTAKSKSTSKSRSKSLSKKKKEKTLCVFHQKKQSRHYGRHVVTVDSSSRVLNAHIFCENWVRMWKPAEMNPDRYSKEHIFCTNSVANIFLTLLRDLKKNLQESNGVCRSLLANEEDWEVMSNYVGMLCHQVKALLRSEPKVLCLAGPAYIIGDLRGSLRDLFIYESRFFRSAPAIPHMLLFLGNYSGPAPAKHGIECICFLFALKVLMPNKVYLLRGLHELRSYNEQYLKTELRSKYGPQVGEKVFELVNGVFDCLPVAATIEESIFCTHSGIPQLESSKELLATMEAEYSGEQYQALREPEKTMPLAYEMITNIPSYYAENKDYIYTKPIFHPCFVPNEAGTYSFFNREAFNEFMAKNKFELLIRSESFCQAGYSMAFDNRCLTLFSSRRCNKLTVDSTSVLQLDPSQAMKGRLIFFPVKK